MLQTMIKSSYLHDVLKSQHLRKIVNRLSRILSSKSAPEFNAIACRGMSGCIVASCLSARLNKNLIVVRKKESSHHSNFQVEGSLNCKKYIIIDDFIGQGGTVWSIISEIHSSLNPKSRCVGIYLYKYSNDNKHRTQFFERKIQKQLISDANNFAIVWFYGPGSKIYKASFY